MHLRGGDVGLPPGQAYACFAETLLLGLAGHVGHFATGTPTLDHVAHVRGLAQRFGVAAAAPANFGRPVLAGAR